MARRVARVQNVGDAMTEGIELEAKFRVSDLWAEAPRIDVRSNASFFRSRVRGVPGPYNQLDGQPDYTANLGLDYRTLGLPLTLGGNLNWTPGYLQASRCARPRARPRRPTSTCSSASS